jgi:hypothetical protein
MITRNGLIRGLGICVLVLGLFILSNIAMLTLIYVDYYDILRQTMAKRIGLIWLQLIFEPTSGAFIGVTLAFIGMGMIKLRKWAQTTALALMAVNCMALACWLFFTQFEYISKTQFVQVVIMYLLIVIFLKLKWIETAFA